MKKLISILVLASIASVVSAAEQSSVVSTNAHPELVRYRFVYVEATPEQQENLDAALARMTLARRREKVSATIEDASALVWESINIAGGFERACTEYKGFFWFSRLDRAGQDDRSFKSGFAVKKRTGEISRWEEDKAQPGGPANGSLPVGH